jgi:hypothetical protein
MPRGQGEKVREGERSQGGSVSVRVHLHENAMRVTPSKGNQNPMGPISGGVTPPWGGGRANRGRKVRLEIRMASHACSLGSAISLCNSAVMGETCKIRLDLGPMGSSQGSCYSAMR